MYTATFMSLVKQSKVIDMLCCRLISMSIWSTSMKIKSMTMKEQLTTTVSHCVNENVDQITITTSLVVYSMSDDLSALK